MTSPVTKREDPEVRLRAMLARFREPGHRLTPQRVALLRILAASEGHPSAGELLVRISEHFPTTSPATVYKMLAVLKDMGEVFEIGSSDHDNRYDGKRPLPHPHLICVRCHDVIDAETDEIEEMSQRLVALYGHQDGFRVSSHRVDLLGVCSRCQSAESDQPVFRTTEEGEAAAGP